MRAALPPLLAGLLLTPPVRAAEPGFQILDRVAPAELEENIAIYMDDALVGSLHLDRAHPEASLHGSASDLPTPHNYRLCGTVVVQAPNGEAVSHKVDASGTVDSVAGRRFEAMTLDFQSFYLRDVTPNAAPARITPGRERGCTAAIS